ncbi:MAG: hypothetical protein ACKV22_21790 [Bryobacteraceae bacterium]
MPAIGLHDFAAGAIAELCRRYHVHEMAVFGFTTVPYYLHPAEAPKVNGLAGPGLRLFPDALVFRSQHFHVYFSPVIFLNSHELLKNDPLPQALDA